MNKSFLPKYKQNLHIIRKGNIGFVKSYDTTVAGIRFDDKQVIELDKWSNTTTKHVNYVASFLGFELIKANKKTELINQFFKNKSV